MTLHWNNGLCVYVAVLHRLMLRTLRRGPCRWWCCVRTHTGGADVARSCYHFDDIGSYCDGTQHCDPQNGEWRLLTHKTIANRGLIFGGCNSCFHNVFPHMLTTSLYNLFTMIAIRNFYTDNNTTLVMPILQTRKWCTLYLYVTAGEKLFESQKHQIHANVNDRQLGGILSVSIDRSPLAHECYYIHRHSLGVHCYGEGYSASAHTQKNANLVSRSEQVWVQSIILWIGG